MYNINIKANDLSGFSFSIDETEQVHPYDYSSDENDLLELWRDSKRATIDGYEREVITIARSEYESLVCNQFDVVSGNGAGVRVNIPRCYGSSAEWREEILEEAAMKPLRLMCQHDYFTDSETDSAANHFVSETWEFRDTECVSVQFPINTELVSVKDALEAILKSVTESIRHGDVKAVSRNIDVHVHTLEVPAKEIDDSDLPF